MSKLKTTFIVENNSVYPKQKGIVNIIGRRPDDAPYLSITFQHEGNQIAHGWLSDNDLERFAVNILKCLKSKKIK